MGFLSAPFIQMILDDQSLYRSGKTFKKSAYVYFHTVTKFTRKHDLFSGSVTKPDLEWPDW